MTFPRPICVLQVKSQDKPTVDLLLEETGSKRKTDPSKVIEPVDQQLEPVFSGLEAKALFAIELRTNLAEQGPEP